MFSNWKIPSRITDELPSSRQVPNIADKESPLTPKRTEEQYARINNSHFLPSSLGKPIDSKRTTNETFRHSKSLRTQQLMKTFKDGPNFTTLDSFLKTANKREKDILEKTMRLIYSRDAGTDDAIKNIEKWLSKASSADRHVAINFFETLGVKMMANSSTEEKDTVKKILSLIRNYHSSDEFSIPRSKTLSHISTTPKYIRLLTPSTRENKWLHQTWHHLPSYHDDNPVFNRSAVYTESGKVPYRHWNIHPDWQLQSQFQQY